MKELQSTILKHGMDSTQPRPEEPGTPRVQDEALIEAGMAQIAKIEEWYKTRSEELHGGTEGLEKKLLAVSEELNQRLEEFKQEINTLTTTLAEDEKTFSAKLADARTQLVITDNVLASRNEDAVASPHAEENKYVTGHNVIVAADAVFVPDIAYDPQHPLVKNQLSSSDRISCLEKATAGFIKNGYAEIESNEARETLGLLRLDVGARHTALTAYLEMVGSEIETASVDEIAKRLHLRHYKNRRVQSSVLKGGFSVAGIGAAVGITAISTMPSGGVEFARAAFMFSGMSFLICLIGFLVKRAYDDIVEQRVAKEIQSAHFLMQIVDRLVRDIG